MKNNRVRAFWLITIGATLLMGMTGCTSYNRGEPLVKRSAYYYPYDYYYYPNTSVYFHISSGYYYYRDGQYWRQAKVLPSHFYLNERGRVLISVRSDKPYLKHNEHRTRYMPRPIPNNKRDINRNQTERKNNKRRHKEYRW